MWGRLLFAAVVALGLASACGKTMSSGGGSNSNWLMPCESDASCGADFECWCGVCTTRCAGAGECGDPAASCVAAEELSCGVNGPAGSACVLPCSGHAECAAVNPALACREGVCVDPSRLFPSVEAPLVELSLGSDFGCVLRGGTVWCWGDDTYGQLGRPPALESSSVALRVPGLDGVVELASAVGHSCARRADGRVFCWGDNAWGQVSATSAPAGTCSGAIVEPIFGGGDGNLPCQPAPSEVPGVDDAVELALGPVQSCARRASGEITCWGRESSGSASLSSVTDAVDVAVSEVSGCAVRGDGRLACDAQQPGVLASWTGVEAVAFAPLGELACARRAGGRVDCWGRNDNGERGLGTAGALPLTVDDASAIAAGAIDVAVGWFHACALLGDGSVQCWGGNGQGEAGAPPNATPRCSGAPCQPAPVTVGGLPPIVKLVAGPTRTCGVTAESQLWCWGQRVGVGGSGVAVRVPGPWEDVGTRCAAAEAAILPRILPEIEAADVACERDEDCTELALESPCYRGCALGPVSLTGSARVRAALDALSDVYCDAAAAAGCDFEPCPGAATGELACDGGACVRWDARGRGCGSLCECRALDGGEDCAIVGTPDPTPLPDGWCLAPPGASGSGGVLDDFEDGDLLSLAVEGHRGAWYSANDETGVQSPAPDAFTVAPGGAADSAFAVGMSGAGFTSWGALFGVMIRSGADCAGYFDASRFSGLGFWARGRGTALVRLNTADTAQVEFGGRCTGDGCEDAFASNIALDTAWTYYEFPFAALRQGGWGEPATLNLAEVVNLSWLVPANTSFEIWVDDVALVP